jgi:CHAT domain-containing protein
LKGILRPDQTKNNRSLGTIQFSFAILFATLGASTAATGQADGEKAIAGTESRSITALWSLADSNLARGNLTEAERILRDAAVHARSDPDKAGTSLRLGLVLTSSGNIADARQELDAAEALRSALTGPVQSQLSLAQGGLAARIGDFVAAEQFFERATSEAKLAGSPSGETRGKLNALRARLDRRELAELESRLSDIYALGSRLSSGDEAATLLIAAGELQRRAVNEFRSQTSLRQFAYQSFNRAREYAQSDSTRAQALGFLGALYEDEGRWDEALRLTSEAVFLAQSINDTVQLYRWEWQTARIQRRRGDLTHSTAAMDRAMTGLADIRNDVLQSSRQAYGSLIEPVYLDYADIHLRRAAAMSEGSAEQQRVLRSVRNQLESLKQAEVQDYFENQCAIGEASAADESFKVPGTAVLYPILLPDRLEVLVESDGVLRRFSTPVSRGEATMATRQLRLGLERPSAGDAYLAPAHSLYRWVFAAAKPWLDARQVNTLIFVPSGALRTIPLGALHDGQEFLIERYAVATTPAVSLTSPQAAPVEGVLLGGLTKSVQGFAGLPSVDEEMRIISSLFPTQAMKDEAFRLDTVRTELSAAEFAVAHLATHGEFSSDYRKSFILTYDDRLTMDGLKTALDGRAAPLDLLVLSACQTAAGDDRAALGLAGVAIQAGAKSALASLWNISDKATAALMTKFYENTKAPGATKAQSLRDAQIALLRSPEYGHPSYWAPYLLIGNWL